MVVILVIVKDCFCFWVHVDLCSILLSNSAAYIGRVMAAVDMDCNIIFHLQIVCYAFEISKKNWNVRDCILAILEIWWNVTVELEVLFIIVIGFGMSVKLLGECGVHESQVQGLSMYYILYVGVWYCWVFCHSSGIHNVFVSTHQYVAERLDRTVWKPITFRWDVVG